MKMRSQRPIERNEKKLNKSGDSRIKKKEDKYAFY